MRKDWIVGNEAGFAAQVEQFLAALDTPEGRTATGLSAAELAALRTEHTTLAGALDTRTEREAALRETVRLIEDTHTGLESNFRKAARAAQNATGMTDALRTAAGLPLRETSPSGPPPIPSVQDLIVLPSTSGKNFLDWSGPTGGGIQYLIHGKKAGTTEFALLDAVTGTEYSHQGAGIGVQWTYYIVPKRRGDSGEPSNEATVYAP